MVWPSCPRSWGLAMSFVSLSLSRNWTTAAGTARKKSAALTPREIVLRLTAGGEDTPAHRDALVLGAALALEVTGAEPDAESAVRRARQAIDDGSAAEFLERLQAFGQELRA